MYASQRQGAEVNQDERRGQRQQQEALRFCEWEIGSWHFNLLLRHGMKDARHFFQRIDQARAGPHDGFGNKV